jgi:hypothetical protein
MSPLRRLIISIPGCELLGLKGPKTSFQTVTVVSAQSGVIVWYDLTTKMIDVVSPSMLKDWWELNRSARKIQRAWRYHMRAFARAKREMVRVDDALWNHCANGCNLHLPWDLIEKILYAKMRLEILDVLFK